MLVKAGQVAMSRHDAARKEVSAHPVALAFFLEEVCESLVCEDMYEELALILEPAGDTAHQFLMVGHVLEHLDTARSVKAQISLKVVDI